MADTKRLLSLLLLLAVLIGVFPGAALAQDDVPDLTDRVALESFVDGVVAAHLENGHVPGAMVAIVADGEVLLSKGYGYADVEARRPVTADETLFRIGSVSKLFVWTAVMQLVEAGELDLHTDVNDYLTGVTVPEAFGEPITMAHLMTHTPGFEDRALGLFARDAENLPTLDEALTINAPERVRPPGEFSSYSNYGTALAAYIVEEITGVPFDRYVEEEILAPLGMTRTTFRQPIPADLMNDLARGYHYRQGYFEAGDAEYVPLYPAGSAIATADDMARFMLAHLQEGELEGARILQPETVAQMRQQLFTHDPRLPGMAHGWMEREINGLRVLQHGGDTMLFHSLLAIIPEQEVGIFVSYNGAQSGMLPDQLFTALIDRYFPTADAAPTPPADFADRAARFTGSYRMNRLSHTNFEKIIALFQNIGVAATPEGYLVVSGPMGIERYVEVEPLVFEQIDGSNRILFREDQNGEITHFFLADFPVVGMERLAWYETPAFHLSVLGGALLLFLATLIGWAIVGVRNLRRRTWTPLGATARWVSALLALVTLVFLIGFAVSLGDPFQAVYGLPPIFDVLVWLPPIVAVLAIATLILAIVAWARRVWGVWGRIHYTAVALVGIALVWVLRYWNLLSV